MLLFMPTDGIQVWLVHCKNKRNKFYSCALSCTLTAWITGWMIWNATSASGKHLQVFIAPARARPRHSDIGKGNLVPEPLKETG